MKRTIILQLLLLIAPILLIAQDNRVIEGKVVGATDGQPLPGASVFIGQSIGTQTDIKGVISNYSIGTITDVDGNFSITIPKEVTNLVVSYIGFEPQSVQITERNNLTVRLVEQNRDLDEVIVTGYQNIKQRKSTSSIAKIESQEILQAAVSSVDQMLQGKLAGVQISVASGAPGTPAKIRIRGTATLAGSPDPLWVLDGIPLEGSDLPDLSGKNIDQLVNSSIAGINPNDIQDITILKDAAATAIYGTRAANGVIVVTTKKGAKGRMDVNLSSNLSVNYRPQMSKLNLLNSNQKVDLELDLAQRADLTYRSDMGAVARILNQYGEYNTFQQHGYDALSIDAKTAIQKLRNTNTDWGKEIYQNALSQNHSLSISGGGDRSNYYFSVGYYDEKGTTKGTGLNRLNLTFKTEYEIVKNLTVGAAIFTSRKNQESYLTSDSFNNPNRYSRTVNPYLAIKDENGYIYDRDITGYNDNSIDFNYIEEHNGTSYTLKAQNITTNFNVVWRPLKYITYTSQLGLQFDNSSAEQMAAQDTYYTRRQRERSRVWSSSLRDFYYFLPVGGIIKNFENKGNQWTWKNLIELNQVVNEKHEIDIMIGNELRRNENSNISTAGYGYDAQTLTTKPIIFPNEDNARSFPLYSKSLQRNAFASFFATASYTYHRRYTLFGSVRYDGSDLFGVDPKYKYLPLWSVGGAWNILNESWMSNLSWLTTFKLRGSYGLQGNIDKNTSPYIVGNYTTVTILPGNTETAIDIVSPPNSKLRWEKTSTLDGGIDLGLLKNRILLSVDGYSRRSSDLVGERSIPLENGFFSSTLNWAEITNRGVEFNITTRNISTKNFKWTTNFNIAKNINKVEKIQVREDATKPSLQGYSVNALFGFKTAGIDADGYPLLWKDGDKVSIRDFFKLNSSWGIPELVSTELSSKEIRDSYSYLGNSDPKLSGGFINTFSYKGITLHISMNIVYKQTVKEEPFYNMTQFDRSINTTSRVNQIWTTSNPTAPYPAIVSAETGGGNRAEEYFFMVGEGQAINVFRDLDIWYKDISYVRVSNIRLSYDFPSSVLKKLRVKTLKLNLETLNPFVFGTSYKGYFDPETYGNIYAQPMSQAFTFGVNLIF